MRVWVAASEHCYSNLSSPDSCSQSMFKFYFLQMCSETVMIPLPCCLYAVQLNPVTGHLIFLLDCSRFSSVSTQWMSVLTAPFTTQYRDAGRTVSVHMTCDTDEDPVFGRELLLLVKTQHCSIKWHHACAAIKTEQHCLFLLHHGRTIEWNSRPFLVESLCTALTTSNSKRVGCCVYEK